MLLHSLNQNRGDACYPMNLLNGPRVQQQQPFSKLHENWLFPDKKWGHRRSLSAMSSFAAAKNVVLKSETSLLLKIIKRVGSQC